MSDSEDANGSQYLPDTNQTVFIPNILATEGNWVWQDGVSAMPTLFNQPFSNWKSGTFDDVASNEWQDWAALDFNDSNGYWVDLNMNLTGYLMF